MIFDTLDHLPQYLPEAVWEKLQPVIMRCGADLPVGKMPIDSSDIFADISVYETKFGQECRFETHTKYSDIQIILSGSEEIGLVPAEFLSAETDKETKKDVRFYKPAELSAAVSRAKLTLTAGCFALFFPQDAHCPQIAAAGEKTVVKKMVIKIDTDLLLGKK